MESNLFPLYHEASKDLFRGHPEIPGEFEKWPEEWKTTYYKNYPRLKKYVLESHTPQANFFDLVRQRESRRDFTGNPLSKKELSLLLQYSSGITKQLDRGRMRRAHPSGGARFPIELYPIMLSHGEDFPSGVYHYNIKEHALDILLKKKFSLEDCGHLFTYKFAAKASCIMIFTAVFWRTSHKYGERGYRFVLLEAGHIAQNMYLLCEALGLKCCALGGTWDQRVEDLLDIDGVTESVVYAIAIGK